jgi:adenosylcobinamide-GDP ribazoletransferase
MNDADPASGGRGDPRGTLLTDLAQGLRFYSRLPVPRMPGETDLHGIPDFTRLARVVPLVGAVLGALVAALLLALQATGLPASVVALLALAASVRLTGAFHEDGLADTADGLGGGRDIAQKLEIMKDSRIGTYGGAALILSLSLRAALIAALLEVSAGLAAASLVAAASLSRTFALALAVSLPPARVDGAAFAAGRPPVAAFITACLIALALVGALIGPLNLPAALAGPVVAALATFYMVRLAARSVGGQTGDLAGATQQVAEIAFLTLVLMFAR